MIRIDCGAPPNDETQTVTVDKHAKKEHIIDLRNEAIIMSFVRHPNVIEFIGYCDDKDVSFVCFCIRFFCFYWHFVQLSHKLLQQPFIALEFCAGGPLDAHIRATQQNLTINDCTHYAYEISRGMRYLSTVNCVHS